MKKLIFTATFLMFIGFNATAQLSLRPQAGIQVANLSYESIQGEVTGKTGLSFGVDLQIGNTFYVQPGLMLTPSNLEINNVGDITLTKLNVPVMVGYRFFEPDGGKAFGMRLFAGPNFAFNVNEKISDAITDITTEDLQSFNLSLLGGVGFDFSILFVDIAYKYGLSETIAPRDGSDGANLNAFLVNAGLRIGF